MTEKENSLCWECKRPGTGSCSWDRRMKPVKGWKAERRFYPSHRDHRRDSYTYHVIECPMFLQDRPVDIKYTVLDKNDIAWMLELLRSGMRVGEVARKLGVSPSKVSRHKKKFIKRGQL